MKRKFGIDWITDEDIPKISKAVDEKIKLKKVFQKAGIDFIG